MAELLLEARLTSRRHVVTEGPTDARFMRVWSRNVENGDKVVITPATNLKISGRTLEAEGLNDGNRARAIYVAKEAASNGVDLVCIADRDGGHNVADHQYSTLFWTDYPAMESYALVADVLDLANQLSFGERLPPGAKLIDDLKHPLREIFAVRAQNEHLPDPKFDAAFKGRNNTLTTFDVTLVVDSRVGAASKHYPRHASSDVRDFAYGHDIADLLLCAFGNAIKNQSGLRTREAVEGALRSALQLEGSFKEEGLFRRLAAWISAGASRVK
ncbi:MAG: hypothetical protein LBE25_10840 [Arthrobacter sp.]|nr:hypothetical protein [Arthrobacter sp.]